MKPSSLILTLTAVSAALVLSGCGKTEPTTPPAKVAPKVPATTPNGSHNHGAHMHGPHGGEVLKVGEHVLHLEVVHKAGSDTLSVHVLDAALKGPAELAEAPVAQIRIAGEPQALPLTGSGSTWSVTNDAFKGRPAGRLAVNTGGKTYSVEINYGH